MSSVLIWTYHRVLPTSGNAALSLDVFGRQMQYLIEKGYSFLDLDGLSAFFKGELPADGLFTIISFDDGWADNLIWAAPILKKFNIKAFLAVNSALVNSSRAAVLSASTFALTDSKKALGDAVYGRDHSSFLTWEELAVMRDSGNWILQSHAASHLGVYENMYDNDGFYPDSSHWTMEYALGTAPFRGVPKGKFRSTLSMPRTRPSAPLIAALKAASGSREWQNICRKFKNELLTIESEEEFELRVRNDLELSKEMMRSKLGIQADALFWPWGHYSLKSIEIARDCGFKYLFTMDKDALTDLASPYAIPRIAAPQTFERFIRQERIFSSGWKRSIHRFFKRSR